MTRRKLTPRRPAMRKPAGFSSEWIEVLNHYAGTALFYFMLMFIVILSWLSLPVSGIAPFWAIVPVYIWSSRWSHMMPAFLMFMIGLISDIVIGTPLGVHALAILIVGLLARLQQRYLATQSFVAVWMNFAAVALLFSLMITGLDVIASREYNGVMAAFSSSVISWMILAVLFPLFSLLSYIFMRFVTKMEA